MLRSRHIRHLDERELCWTRIPLHMTARSGEQQEQERRQAVMHHRYHPGERSRWLSFTGLAVQCGH
jgi:hypothetical protein